MNIKVQTYNIQHGLDYIKLLDKQRIIDLDKICQVIESENPDIIGLNEVYNDVLEKETVEQVKYIANKLGYKYYYFGQSITIKETIGYGNAIISRYPIENCQVIKIEDPIIKDENVYYESRSIIDCDVLINDEIIKVYVTHLGLAKSEQTNGIKTISSLIKNKKTILMGDFNMIPTDNNIILLKQYIDDSGINFKDNMFTYPSINSKMKIDYIFSKNINLIDSYILNKVASDHLSVVAIYKIN